MKRIFNGSGGRKAALILSLCLIFALAAGGTLAYLKAHTPPVTNTFTAAKSTLPENYYKSYCKGYAF